MRICIYGAGAIGGYLGAELALSGQEVTLIARGPHLAAMQERGLTLRMGEDERTAHPKCVNDPAEAGEQDYVIIALKAPAVPAVVERMKPLLGPDTAVVTATNGVPWWYFYKLEGPYENHQLESVDPGGKQWKGIGPERVIGCVVYPACEVTEPGVIQHIYGNRFSLGEPSNERTERLVALADALKTAGFKVPIRNIRNEIWIKLWGNLCFNPISALTHATLDVIASDACTRPIVRSMMFEAQAIGEKLGAKFSVDVDRRIQGAHDVGAHKTSMLQDLERGRTMEVDALVTAVQEMGRLLKVPSPTLDIVLGLVQQRARVADCY